MKKRKQGNVLHQTKKKQIKMDLGIITLHLHPYFPGNYLSTDNDLWCDVTLTVRVKT